MKETGKKAGRYPNKWTRMRASIGSDNVNEVTLRLIERWPNAFTDPPVPLLIGIHRDIVPKMNHDKSLILLALHDWTFRTSYLRALLRAGPRYDLDGVAYGVVTENEKTSARIIIERREGG